MSERGTTVTIVVAIGDNGVIGRDGQLPWPPTGDLAHFKALTMGWPIVSALKCDRSPVGGHGSAPWRPMTPLSPIATTIVTVIPRWGP